MKKLMVSGALALALSTSLVAEESGAFVGVDLGISNAAMTQEMGDLTNSTFTIGNFRYGLMGGYKYFFTESFGLRAYLQVNNGTNHGAQTMGTMEISAGGSTIDIPVQNGRPSFSTLNVMANVDALYNFYTSEQSSAGLFAGLSFGYAIHYGGVVKEQVDLLDQMGISYNPSGFDMGINFGLRTIFAKNHGVEFFSRFGVVGASNSYNLGADVKENVLQPYAFGARYTYNF